MSESSQNTGTLTFPQIRDFLQAELIGFAQHPNKGYFKYISSRFIARQFKTTSVQVNRVMNQAYKAKLCDKKIIKGWNHWYITTPGLKTIPNHPDYVSRIEPLNPKHLIQLSVKLDESLSISSVVIHTNTTNLKSNADLVIKVAAALVKGLDDYKNTAIIEQLIGEIQGVKILANENSNG